MSGSLKPSFGAIVQQARDNVLKDFPSERLKYVQEGDFAQALRLLREMKDAVLAYRSDFGPAIDDYDYQRTDAVTEFLDRLQPEPEDSP